MRRCSNQSESYVHEELAQLEHLYATAPVGLCLHSADGRILRINERLASMDGLPAADHIGHTLRELVPEVAKVVEPILHEVIKSGQPSLDLEVRTATPARPSIVGLVSFHPLKSASGVVEAVSVVVQDITERKQAEEALRTSEERLSRILESAMDAIVTIDGTHRIQLFNSAAEAVFCCPAREAMGSSFDRFMSAGFRDVLDLSAQAFKRGGTGKPYVWVPEGLSAVRANGKEFAVEGTVSFVEVGGQDLYTVILRDVNQRKQAEAELRRLQAEVVYLREEARSELEFGEIVGSSQGMRRLLGQVRQVASSDSTVLITGETGTGKELVARAIHELSARKDKVLVTVNCAALPGGLIESELFGHEKGAFTGALSQKLGRFEMADQGTIFLDEIGDLPLELQAKLLRVLQEGEFERVGASKTRKADVRVIAATNRELEAEVTAHRFRADLFYRLNVFPIRVPPLRERTDDIPPLASHFAMKHATKMGRRLESIPKTTLEALSIYTWPGNVRELQNVIERGVILSKAGLLELGDWPPTGWTPGEVPSIVTLAEAERRHILRALERTKWRVSGRNGAAEVLGLKPTTLHARIKKLGIQKPT